MVDTETVIGDLAFLHEVIVRGDKEATAKYAIATLPAPQARPTT